MSTESAYPENLLALHFAEEGQPQVAADWLLKHEFEYQDGWFYSDPKQVQWPDWVWKGVDCIAYYFWMGVEEGMIPYSYGMHNEEEEWDDSSWSFRRARREEQELYYNAMIIPLDSRWNYEEERPYTWAELGFDR